MSDLIDRQALKSKLKRWDENDPYEFVEIAFHAVDDAPTIDAVEVVHGEWIIDGAYTYDLKGFKGPAYEPVYRCSCCHRQTESYLRLDEPKMPEDADFPEFCPHCGARMDGERRER